MVSQLSSNMKRTVLCLRKLSIIEKTNKKTSVDYKYVRSSSNVKHMQCRSLFSFPYIYVVHHSSHFMASSRCTVLTTLKMKQKSLVLQLFFVPLSPYYLMNEFCSCSWMEMTRISHFILPWQLHHSSDVIFNVLKLVWSGKIHETTTFFSLHSSWGNTAGN